jgi:hypothetical protein
MGSNLFDGSAIVAGPTRINVRECPIAGTWLSTVFGVRACGVTAFTVAPRPPFGGPAKISQEEGEKEAQAHTRDPDLATIRSWPTARARFERELRSEIQAPLDRVVFVFPISTLACNAGRRPAFGQPAA